MQLTANWSYPTAIRFGAGRIGEIADACKSADISKPLLVTDRGLASLPITQNTLTLLDQAGLGKAMFAEVDPNPNEKNLALGLKAYNDGGHDGIVAFGRSAEEAGRAVLGVLAKAYEAACVDERGSLCGDRCSC